MARKQKPIKTNAMRELERAGVAFDVAVYEADEGVPQRELGVRIAAQLGADPESQFKTLVTVTPEGGHVVCCIPVAEELDLKKAAAAAGEKSLSMLPMRELEPVCGYVRGACTPVGMKKLFPTLIDETAQLFDRIGISGGAKGVCLGVNPEDMASFIGARFADIVR